MPPADPGVAVRSETICAHAQRGVLKSDRVFRRPIVLGLDCGKTINNSARSRTRRCPLVVVKPPKNDTALLSANVCSERRSIQRKITGPDVTRQLTEQDTRLYKRISACGWRQSQPSATPLHVVRCLVCEHARPGSGSAGVDS